jgi:WD40 repeat protein
VRIDRDLPAGDLSAGDLSAGGIDAPVARAYRRASHRLRAAAEHQRAGILQAMALTEEPAALDEMGLPDRGIVAAAGWSPLWSRGYRSAFHLTLTGHTTAVTALAFTTVAGRTALASGGTDRTVRLWDAVTGEPLSGLTGPGDDVVALESGPAGDRTVLAAAARDGAVRVWDVDTREPLVTITMAEGRPTGIALLATGTGRDVLATASATDRGYGTVDLWDPVTGEHLARIHDDAAVRGLIGLPVDGRTLLAGIGYDDDLDATGVLVWDAGTGAREASLAWRGTPADADTSGSFVPPLLVLAGPDRVWLGADTELDCPSHDYDNTCGTVVWWDARTFQEVGREQLSWNTRVLAGTTVDGRDRIATCEYYRSSRTGETLGPDVCVRPVERGRWTDLQGHAGRVRVARFGTVGGSAVLATAGDDTTVLLWDAATEHRHPAASGPQGSGLAVATGPSGPVLVRGTAFGYLELLDPATGAEVRSMFCHASGQTRGHRCEDDDFEHCAGYVAGATVGGLVASCGRHGSGVVVWDPATGRAVRDLDCASNVMAFGEVDGRPVLATNNYAGRPTTVWDPTTGARLAELPDGAITRRWSAATLDFGTAAGRPVLATGLEHAVNLWDPLTAEHLLSLPGVAERPSPTPAGIRLAAGHDVVAVTDVDEVRVWETTTGYPLSTVINPDGPVTCLAVTTVGHRGLIVTGDRTGTVRLWDAATADLVSTLATFARTAVAVTAATLDGQTHVFAQCVSGRVVACRLDAETP